MRGQRGAAGSGGTREHAQATPPRRCEVVGAPTQGPEFIRGALLQGAKCGKVGKVGGRRRKGNPPHAIVASRHIHAGSSQTEGMPTSHEAKFPDVSLNSNGSSSQRPCVLSRVPSARARISLGRTGEVGWSGGFFLCWAFYPIAAWTVMHVFTPSIVPSTDSLIKSSPNPDPASRRAAEQTSARSQPQRAAPARPKAI